MDESFCDFQLAGWQGHEEIDVVDSAVGSFHIHAGKVFAAAEA